MNFGMISQDKVKYVNEVKNYVEGVLNLSLSAKIEGNPEKEHNNLVLLNKLLSDASFRNEIVERITAYGIKCSMGPYLINLEPNARRTVFMRKIYSFLDVHQISLLASYFDKELEQVTAKSR